MFKQIAMVLDKILTIYGKHWIILLPLAFLSALSGSIEDWFHFLMPAQALSTPLMFLVSLLQLILSTIFSIALFWQINALLHKGWASYKNAIEFGFKRVLPVCVAYLLTFIVTIFSLAGLFIMAAFLGKNILSFLFVFVGGCFIAYFLLRLTMLTPTVIFESRPLLDSFAYTFSLTKGKRAFYYLFILLTVVPVVMLSLIAIPLSGIIYLLPTESYFQALAGYNGNHEMMQQVVLEFYTQHHALIFFGRLFLYTIVMPLLVITFVVLFRQLQAWHENQRTGYAVIKA